jgi:transcription antitermination factor NusG
MPDGAEQSWFALRVKHRHEKAVAQSLDGKGYQRFLPLYWARQRRFTERRDVEIPLFAGYVFCRMKITNRLPILMIPGVFHIVRMGKFFSVVDDGEIQALQKVVASNLYAQPWPFLKQGQLVAIEEGPLNGLCGILTEVQEKKKLVVSVTLLQRSVAVEVDRRWIRLIGPGTPAPGVYLARERSHDPCLT